MLNVLYHIHPSSAGTQLMRVDLILPNVQVGGDLFTSSPHEDVNITHLRQGKLAKR
jgi:hypothetical protein